MKQTLLVFFFFLSAMTMAQEKGSIQGLVLDKEVNNEPLAFVTVLVKGTQINTTTDLDGIHTLEVNAGTYTLVFNFPGYQKVEIPNILVKQGQITQVQKILLTSLKFPFSKDTSSEIVEISH